MFSINLLKIRTQRGVEGADPNTIRAVFHKAVDAVRISPCRLVCKGDRQNIPGLHPFSSIK